MNNPYNMFEGIDMGPNWNSNQNMSQKPAIDANGLDLSPWKKFGIGVNGVTSLAGMIGSFQDRKLMKRQMEFNESLARANLSNSAVTTNQALADRAIMAGQLTSGAEYGTDAMVKASNNAYNPVSGNLKGTPTASPSLAGQIRGNPTDRQV